MDRKLEAERRSNIVYRKNSRYLRPMFQLNARCRDFISDNSSIVLLNPLAGVVLGNAILL